MLTISNAFKANDVWTMVAVLKKININEIIDGTTPEMKFLFTYKCPQKMVHGALANKSLSEFTEGERRAYDKYLIAQNDFSMLVIKEVISSVTNCKNEIDSLIASACGITVEEVNEASGIEYVAALKNLITREETKDFFTEASELLGLKNRITTSFSEGTQTPTN